MKILVDETIPIISVIELKRMGHDVKDIRGTPDEGLADDLVWEMVIKENRLLITTDKGFAKFREENHPGILIILLKRPNQKKIHNRIMKAVNQIKENEWPGLLLIMRDNTQSI